MQNGICLSGSSVGAFMQGQSTSTTKPQSEYDLVVVGSGGASMIAGLAARKLGRSVAILEKQDKIGGSTALSGGVWWVPNNALMARAGIADSYDKALTYLNAVVTYKGPATSPARQQAFLRAAPHMVEFLEREGMRFRRPRDWPDYNDDLPGGSAQSRTLMAEHFNLRRLGPWADRLATHIRMKALPIGTDEFPSLFLVKRTFAGKLTALKAAWGLLKNLLPGTEIVANGAAIQGRMLEMALARGVEIFPQAKVEELVAVDGAVVGVRLAGGEVVRARSGVLLDSGGFSRNPDMRREFQRAPIHSEWTNANVGDTGEVMRAAMKLGAATDAMDAAVWIATSHRTDGSYPASEYGPDGRIYPPLHHLELSLPFLIAVDQDGRRAFNESASYVEIGEAIYKRQAATGRAVPCWVIFDARNRQRYPWGSQSPGVTPEDWIKSGYMKKAGSLAELADQCGINAEGLQSTVSRFNEFARSGIDADFNRGGRAFDRAHGDPTVKPNPNLGAIEEAPFYAVALYPGDVGTSGGLVTDQYARVLRNDGSVIGNLYAAGNVAASPFGYCYPGAGASIAASFTFGWVAALHALQATDELGNAFESHSN
jgi:3-oxosteroid 1-dehydrogenase